MRRIINQVYLFLCVILLLSRCKSAQYPLYYPVDQIECVCIIRTDPHTRTPKSLNDLKATVVKMLEHTEIDSFISALQAIDAYYIWNDAAYSVEGLGTLIAYTNGTSQVIGENFGFYFSGDTVKDVYYGLNHDGFSDLVNGCLSESILYDGFTPIELPSDAQAGHQPRHHPRERG